MQQLATACEAIAGTTKKLLKTGIVADYLKSRTIDQAAVSAIFLSGRAFPAWEETTLQFGGRSLWQIVAELSGSNESQLNAAYRRHGDLGAVAGEVLPQRSSQGLGVLEVESTFRQIARARGPAAKSAIVRDLLSRATPLEAKYIVKIMTGDLRIGLKESLVEDAIARAYGSTVSEVQRANMLLGHIGETVRLASQGTLAQAQMRLFHPLGFMLASPIESAEEGLSYFAEAAVEDKYDGIRAQAHVSDGEVKFFSRTRDEITESFPGTAGRARRTDARCDSGRRDCRVGLSRQSFRYQAGRGRTGIAGGRAKSCQPGTRPPFQHFAATSRPQESQRKNAARRPCRLPRVRRIVRRRRVGDRPSSERTRSHSR